MDVTKLQKRGACNDAVKWARSQKSAQSAWDTCKRGDWMLWLLGKLAGKPGEAKRRKLVLAACSCARLSLPHVSAGEMRPLKAIETAEAWARCASNVSIEDVHAAADAADAAYAAAAAYAAYAADARTTILARCAALVRQHYPKAPRI